MIKVDNLSYSYPGSGHPVLLDLSFTISEGEIFGFLGPSGAGKSTTQNVLIGILKNYQGSVQVMGKEIRSISPRFYEQIGVSFEFPNLYLKFSAVENLKLFSSFYRCEKLDMEVLLQRLGLWEDRNMKVEAFSKGMRMRLNFARAILHQPKVLFLDEPTSGLDPGNAHIVKSFIQELRNKGTTIFLTTHNMSVADELCDRLAFMVDGHLSLIDSPHNLKLQYGKKSIVVQFGKNGMTQQKEFGLKKLGDNHEFIDLINSDNIETIHTQEASLEDIFMQITGKGLI